MDYNLLRKEWIPMLYRDGQFRRIGICQALTDAGKIRQIAASNPMDRVALLRFLLAVLQWCKPSLTDEDRKRLEIAKGIPDDWLKDKLGTEEQCNAAFDFLRDRNPFYQDDPSEDVKPVAVTNLLHELPSGSKIAHFRHTRDYREGICLPCCALAIVRWPAVASAGTAGAGQSMTASINGNTPAYSVPLGGNLLATLPLGWPSVHLVEGRWPCHV